MNGFFVCTPVFCGVEKVAVVRMIVINGFKSVHCYAAIKKAQAMAKEVYRELNQ